MRIAFLAGLIASSFIFLTSGEHVASASEPKLTHAEKDQARCQEQGFPRGSTALATCMGNRAAIREAKARRSQEWMQNFEAQERYDQHEKEKKKEKKRKNRNRAEPTGSEIPGMVCSGKGKHASCDALSEY